MESQVGFWNGIPSGIVRIPGGILLSIVSFESLRLENLDNPCKIFVGIPPGIPGGIPSGIPDGIPGGILERDPKLDPKWDQKQALARIFKVGSQVKSRVVFAGYELLSQICNSVVCERPRT